MDLSIIIPAYNEEKRIGKTLQEYASFFDKRYKKDFEIIVVLNACRDNTLGVVKSFEKRFQQISHLDFKRGGKGFALIEGFKVARGNLIGFTDADDSTSVEEFYKLITRIEGYDGVIASRWMKGSVVNPKQTLVRRIASRGFNSLVNLIFGLKYYDTQCGAKIFRGKAIKSILTRLGITEWAFDIDLLYQLKKSGYRILEMPIRWEDSLGSKLNVPKTSTRMFFSVIRLRLINSPFKGIVKAYDGMPEWIKIHHRLE